MRELQSSVDKQINATVATGSSSGSPPSPSPSKSTSTSEGLLALAESLLPELSLGELLRIRTDLDNVLIASLSLGGGGSGSGGEGEGEGERDGLVSVAEAKETAKNVPIVNATTASTSPATEGAAGGAQTQMQV